MGELDGSFYDVSGFKVTKNFLLQKMINYYNRKPRTSYGPEGS